MDITYHYPPELLQLLVDAIPRLCRGKKDVLLFFRGAGVARSDIADLEGLVAAGTAPRKFDMARTILQRMNEQGERGLRERRELIKRVVEFENFSACWPSDQLQAKGLVAEIRHVVNVKDSFTRMHQEREAERQKHISKQQAEQERLRQRRDQLAAARRDLTQMLTMKDHQKRGTMVEGVLNTLFKVHEIHVRDSFKRMSPVTGRTLEQIDGVIRLDGFLCLIEVKWLSDPVTIEDVAHHLVRVFTRDATRGIFISATPYTEAAVQTCKDALARAVVALCLLEDIVLTLEREGDLSAFLRSKVDAAILEKDPFRRGAM